MTPADAPYVLLSCSMSLDGYLDDTNDERLLLSNEADFDRVDAVRAGCDAILVGAGTVRLDNPRLRVRSAQRRADRVARGLCDSPAKVTVTSRGDLDPSARFFSDPDTATFVYCTSPAAAKAQERLGHVATVIDAGEPVVDLSHLIGDLRVRGVDRLMVEGGASLHTQFLAEGLVDELHLVIAPFFVGDSRAPRFVHDGAFPWGPHRRANLVEVEQIGDVALMRYALSDRFDPA